MTISGGSIVQTASEESMDDMEPMRSCPQAPSTSPSNNIGLKSSLFGSADGDSSTGKSPHAQQDHDQDDQSKPTNVMFGPEPRHTIDDCIRDIAKRQAVSMPGISDPDGDTLVFIDPPGKQPEQSERDYEDYVRCYKEPIVMKSAKLKASSDVFRARLDDPTAQYRMLRRRGLVNKLIGKHRYILDLTPPLEGDDAVYLTATLSCSEGVRLWHLAGDIWRVSDTLVGGKEGAGPKGLSNGSRDRATPPEYSPIRHRSAIERVLAAIQDKDLKLDTAVKVWTTAVISQFFNIKHNFLTDSIVSWLRVEPNFYFFEVNPEITLRIGIGFENQDVTRDAFAILVGEEALEFQIRARKFTSTKQISSTFGRKKDDLPEVLQERVNYASKSFVERTVKEFEALVNPDMHWLDGLPTIQKLLAFQAPRLRHIATMLKKSLKAYVRSAICKVLCSDYLGVPGPHLPGAGGEDLVPRWSRTRIWSTLLPTERLFTRTFWQALKTQTILGNKSNYSFTATWVDDETWATHPYDGSATQGLCLCRTEHREVSTGSLRDIVHKGQIASKKHRIESLNPTYRATNADTNPSQIHSNSFAAETMTENLAELKLSDRTTHALHSVSPSADEEASMALYKETQALHDEPPPYSDVVRMDSHGRNQTHLLSLGTEYKPSDSPHPESISAGTQSDMVPFTSATDLENFSYNFHSSSHPIFFNLEKFFLEAHNYVKMIAARKLDPSDVSARQYPYQPKIVNTLTSLQEDDWKYLPLWAGGYDDGTGAVYTDDIMETTLDAGFAPGHGIHTAASTYSESSSEYDMVSDADIDSSFNDSLAVNDGFSDQMNRHRTYAASSAASTNDDSMVDVAADEEEAQARRQVEALEHIQQAEAEAAIAKRREQRKPWEDSDYSDMFTEEDEEQGEDQDYDSDATETGEDFEHVSR